MIDDTVFLQLKISCFLEGKKHWRLYEPADKLPRFSSHNMSQEDLGTPILETDLEPGDLLYLPRGTIHQVKYFFCVVAEIIRVKTMDEEVIYITNENNIALISRLTLLMDKISHL